MSASSLSAAVQLSPTAASHAGGPDTSPTHAHLQTGPVTSMISQPGVFVETWDSLCRPPASMQGPFLNQSWGERHLGWIQLQGVASGSTGPCPGPVDRALAARTTACLRGQTARSTGRSFHEQRAQFRGSRWGRSHKTPSVSPEQALLHSGRQVRLLRRLGSPGR